MAYLGIFVGGVVLGALIAYFVLRQKPKLLGGGGGDMRKEPGRTDPN